MSCGGCWPALFAAVIAASPAMAVEPAEGLRYNSPTSSAGAVAIAHQATAVGVISGGGTGNGGAAALTIHEASSPKAPSRVTVRNTPDVSLSNIAPTAPCIVAITAGLSLAGGAIGFGGGTEDKDCSIRETARSFHALGLVNDALATLCQSVHAAAAPSCK